MTTFTRIFFAATAILSMAASTFACERTYYRYSSAAPRAAAVQPVYLAPAVEVVYRPAQPADPDVRTGSTLGIAANFLGNEAGFVLLRTGNTTQNVEIKKWTSTGVVVKLPDMGVSEPISAQVDVVLPSGKVAKSARVRLIQQASLVIFDDQPTAISTIAQDAEALDTRQATTGGLSLNPAASNSIKNASTNP